MSVLDLLSEADGRIEGMSAADEASTLEVLERLENWSDSHLRLTEALEDVRATDFGPLLAAMGEAIHEAIVLLQSADILRQQLTSVHDLIRQCRRTLEAHPPVPTSWPEPDETADPHATLSDRTGRQTEADRVFSP